MPAVNLKGYRGLRNSIKAYRNISTHILHCLYLMFSALMSLFFFMQLCFSNVKLFSFNVTIWINMDYFFLLKVRKWIWIKINWLTLIPMSLNTDASVLDDLGMRLTNQPSSFRIAYCTFKKEKRKKDGGGTDYWSMLIIVHGMKLSSL